MLCNVCAPAFYTPADKLQAANNNREHIIKVVRYAARQQPDRLHFLRLSRLFFGFFFCI